MLTLLYRRYARACSASLATALLGIACSGSPTGPTTPSIKITSITPPSGSTTGGVNVTVTGVDFGADTTLTVGGVAASSLVVQGSTTLTGTIPAHPAAGPLDVVVSSGGKTATLARGFSFIAPSGSNQPPLTLSVRSTGPRANQPAGFVNIDDAMTLNPTIANAESSSLLQFAWTGPGSFSPPSADGSTTWRVPNSATPSPQPFTATLMVSETFTEGGVSHVQMAPPYGVILQVHDSEREVMDMGEDFLTLFTRQLSPDAVLHNFSPTCDGGRGRGDEAEDVKKNNDTVIEDINAFRISRRTGFSINFRGACNFSGKPPQLNVDACSSFAVRWEGTDKKTNARFVVNGIDYVSAVVENNTWRLCHSSFVGTESYPALGITRAVAW